MINLNFKDYEEKKSYQKNILYKINKAVVIPFEEMHKDINKCERVDLIFDLSSRQYGIFAYEYRNPVTLKQGCKTADILACAVDESEKKVNTFIFDVKSNISAFSDNLLRDNALLTVIKEVRDFVEQIHAEILHKNSFILYYKDDGFTEHENIGLITKKFEKDKFIAAADLLEGLFENETAKVPGLVKIKLKNNLGAYKNEVKRIRDFSGKRVILCGKEYDLSLILLEKVSESEYAAAIKIALF